MHSWFVTWDIGNSLWLSVYLAGAMLLACWSGAAQQVVTAGGPQANGIWLQAPCKAQQQPQMAAGAAAAAAAVAGGVCSTLQLQQWQCLASLSA